MVGIEGGTDLARGDEPMFLVGVVEPETEGDGSVEGLLGEGNAWSFQLYDDGSRVSFSSSDILDLFSSRSTPSSLSIAGGEADRFLLFVTPVEEPTPGDSVATVTSAFRAIDRACLRGDWSRGIVLK